MPLETADFISELNPAWPEGTDSLTQGDDHLRVTKKAVQQSFPNVDKAVDATADDLNTLTGATNNGVLVPTGAILPYAAATPPDGYLLCDGAAIDPQFSALIALIGANTPDLRGQFLRGWSVDTSIDPDGPRLPLDGPQADEFQSHQHGPAGGHNHSVQGRSSTTGLGSTFQIGGLDGNATTGSTDPVADHQHPAAGGAETRPTNVVVAYIIKT